MKLKRIGHVALRVGDEEKSRAFYRDVLGFDVSENDPEHGGTFMTLGDNFHTIDVFPAPEVEGAQRPKNGQIGLFHIAFEVGAYTDLRGAYCTLQDYGVPISHCTDHVSQRSIYFSDPDGNRLEIYYEMPDALTRFAEVGRGDEDVPLEVTRPGEPLPAWLDEDWPSSVIG
ncbi:MAG TPA: VOC family protein [Dehalococcoidia bacterium]|nr:VOC family protein [Dehalococcoidia bacterium]